MRRGDHRLEFNILVRGVRVPAARSPQCRRHSEAVEYVHVARALDAHDRWAVLYHLFRRPGKFLDQRFRRVDR